MAANGATTVYDVLACDLNTGPVQAKIVGSYAYWGGSSGAGRYRLALATGLVTNLDPNSNFHPPDSSIVFAASQNAIGTNLFEGGSAASGTAVMALANGREVTCFYQGLDNETPGLPVYYFEASPLGTPLPREPHPKHRQQWQQVLRGNVEV